MLVVDQSQCFMVVLVVTTVCGYVRGWAREVITTAVLLGTVLFLLNGGQAWLAHAVLVALPARLRLGGAGALAGTPPPEAGAVIGLFALAAGGGLAYLIGHRFGGTPRQLRHRTIGMLPGAANGMAVAFALSRILEPGTRVALSSPSDGMTQSYLLALYGLGLAGLVVMLLMSVVTGRGRG